MNIRISCRTGILCYCNNVPHVRSVSGRMLDTRIGSDTRDHKMSRTQLAQPHFKARVEKAVYSIVENDALVCRRSKPRVEF
ncbi:hypothetical protein D9M72_392400 [compost metagenome]